VPKVCYEWTEAASLRRRFCFLRNNFNVNGLRISSPRVYMTTKVNPVLSPARRVGCAVLPDQHAGAPH